MAHDPSLCPRCLRARGTGFPDDCRCPIALRRTEWLAVRTKRDEEGQATSCHVENDAVRVLLDASHLFQAFVSKISDGDDPWGDAAEFVLAERSAGAFDAAVLARTAAMIRELDFEARVGRPVHVGPGGRGAMQASDEDTTRLRLIVLNPRLRGA